MLQTISECLSIRFLIANNSSLPQLQFQKMDVTDIELLITLVQERKFLWDTSLQF